MTSTSGPTCPSCGAAAAGRFCATCGASLAGAAAQPMETTPPDSAAVNADLATGDARPDAASWVHRIPRNAALICVGVAVVVIVAVVVLAAGGGSTVTMRGDLSMSDTGYSGFGATGDTQSVYVNDDGSCTAGSGYDDIDLGTEVTVMDPAGKVIGTGSLGAGAGDETSSKIVGGVSQVARQCTWTFTIGGLPKEKFYKVEVSHRGQVTYTAQQVEDGQVHLTLG